MSGITVIVASFRRVDRLAACLAGLRGQTSPVDEVVVVGRRSDLDTARCVARLQAEWPELRYEPVDAEGAVAAYNHGLRAARQPLVGYIDDDAVPAPDWTARIRGTFAQDERIAAVGGRDILDDAPARVGGASSDRVRVGHLQWCGRMRANHHLGHGPARDVDFLKGVNMSFRRTAVLGHGFDRRLRGSGAQVHCELSICLPLRRQGLRLVYDPAIVVRHYPAPRPAGDHRDSLEFTAISAAAHNEALAILEHLGPVRRCVYAVWGVLVGTTEAPGLAVSVRDLARRRPAVARRLWATQQGRAAAWSTRRTQASPAPARAGGVPQPDGVMSGVAR